MLISNLFGNRRITKIDRDYGFTLLGYDKSTDISDVYTKDTMQSLGFIPMQAYAELDDSNIVISKDCYMYSAGHFTSNVMHIPITNYSEQINKYFSIDKLEISGSGSVMMRPNFDYLSIIPLYNMKKHIMIPNKRIVAFSEHIKSTAYIVNDFTTSKDDDCIEVDICLRGLGVVVAKTVVDLDDLIEVILEDGEEFKTADDNVIYYEAGISHVIEHMVQDDSTESLIGTKRVHVYRGSGKIMLAPKV